MFKVSLYAIGLLVAVVLWLSAVGLLGLMFKYSLESFVIASVIAIIPAIRFSVLIVGILERWALD